MITAETAKVKQILVLVGHPDPAPARYVRQLAGAYIRGARRAGHTVQIVDVAALDFPLLKSKAEYENSQVPPALKDAHDRILEAAHIAMFFPLWLGEMPALLKGFLEQVLRVGDMSTGGGKPLKGKSARLVVTMGMPAFIYRFFFRAHGIKNLKRNILGFCGVTPVRTSLIGMVDGKDPRPRAHWLARMERFGCEGV